jgi:F-type H+-transporting ATPase subunit delta
MTGGSLPKRYARALLELVRADDAAAAAGDELGQAAAAFSEPRLRPLVMSPIIDAAARLKIVKAVVAALGLSKAVGNFVALLAERDRLSILPDVARWYDALLDEELGRARAVIRSAAPLSPAERSALVELARRLTGCREVIATTSVDPELLGGVVLDVGGTVYDGSVQTQLVRLSKEMAEGGA